MFKEFHSRFIFGRRIKVLSRELSALIGQDIKTILDIGCGDGSVSKLIQDNNPQLTISGIDVLARPDSKIPVTLYDGKKIPFDDNSIDVCMLIDVLHHLNDVRELLIEAKRVSCKYILLKDHQYSSDIDFRILKLMDEVGNKPYGVALAYNYLKEEQWNSLFTDTGLSVVSKQTSIPLYPFPFNMIFGRKLHFIVLLEKIK